MGCGSTWLLKRRRNIPPSTQLYRLTEVVWWKRVIRRQLTWTSSRRGAGIVWSSAVRELSGCSTAKSHRFPDVSDHAHNIYQAKFDDTVRVPQRRIHCSVVRSCSFQISSSVSFLLRMDGCVSSLKRKNWTLQPVDFSPSCSPLETTQV